MDTFQASQKSIGRLNQQSRNSSQKAISKRLPSNSTSVSHQISKQQSRNQSSHNVSKQQSRLSSTHKQLTANITSTQQPTTQRTSISLNMSEVDEPTESQLYTAMNFPENQSPRQKLMNTQTQYDSTLKSGMTTVSNGISNYRQRQF